MILGGLSLSEEPISSQRVDAVVALTTEKDLPIESNIEVSSLITDKDLPIEVSPFLAIEPKILCWNVELTDTEWCLEECPLEWSFECNSEWSVNSCDTCN